MKKTYVTPSMQVVELEPMGIIASSGDRQLEMNWRQGGEGQDASEDFEVL